jgi:hypothetical protein
MLLFLGYSKKKEMDVNCHISKYIHAYALETISSAFNNSEITSYFITGATPLKVNEGCDCDELNEFYEV